ncbi:MFS transporter [Rossellomorea marisflavi]|uniref:MFS transporter n=1 Tax=Rossellomorea marisflavi TaxID=189381 RepID=UPI003D2EA75D
MKRPSKTPVTLVALITALSLLGDSMLYIVLPLYWKEAGLDSIWQVGILLSINRFIRMPFNPLVGWLYHRISLRTGLIIAVTLGTITTIGYGLASSFIVWVILRSLWGIAWSFFRIGGLSTVVLYSQEGNRGQSMGVYNGLYRTGSLGGMLLGGLLVPLFGMQTIAILFGCLSLVGIPLVLFYLAPINRGDEEQSSLPATMTLSRSTLFVIASGFIVTLLFQGVFASTISSLLEHLYGVKVSLFGLVLSVAFFSGLLQSLRWVWEPYLASRFGRWSDGKAGRLPLLILSLTGASLTFGLMSVTMSITYWTLVAIIVMIWATALTTLTDALASDAAKHTNVVSFLTLYSICQDVGAALGPFLGYLLIGLHYGFSALYWGGSLIFAVLTITWLIIYRRQQRVGAMNSRGMEL